jgi:hypothetical protein
MSLRFAIAGLVGLAASVAHFQSNPLIGCYRADRLLGFSAVKGGNPYRVDEELFKAGIGLDDAARFRLLDNGRIARPGLGMESSWAAGSRWHAKGDTLFVELSQLAVGWELRLLRNRAAGDSSLVGDVHYISDVITTDALSKPRPPTRVRVRAMHETCPPT